MKKNRLFIVVGIIVVVLVGYLIFQSTSKDPDNQTADSSSAETATIGVLQLVSHPALDEIYRGVQDGLKENGYEDGENAKIIFQNGQGDQSKLKTMSEKLVQDKSDVLIGIATPAAQSLANETTEIPIVLGAVTDPVSAGLVTDEEKPGGNITGVSDKSPVDAQIDLAMQLLPDAQTMGVIYSSAEDNSKYQMEEAKKEAESKGLAVKTYAVPSTNEIAQTVQVMAGEVDFIYIPTDNTIASAMQTVVNEANKTNTPIIPSVDTMVSEGGLATVGINQYELGVQTGKMAAEILSGKSDPATTPIYTFKTGDIIINEKQAEKLGVTIPADVLAEATIVGE